MKKLFILALIASLCFTAGCAGSAPSPEPPAQPAENTELPDIIHGSITMEDGGVMEFELYSKVAPQSVLNFVSLARQGYYDGLTFHRIISGMMIQGGCPDNSGTGGPGYTIKGEFSENGFANDLSHTRGVMSMARKDDFDSAGSQFFIVHEDSKGWDGKYATFGKVIDGLDVLDKLAATPVSGGNGAVALEDRPVIRTITIDDF